MDALFAYLGTVDGASVVFGVFLRCLGAVQFISLWGWFFALTSLAGTSGLSPADRLLQAYKRDFGVKALFYWPSLMWGMLLFPRRYRDTFMTAIVSLGLLSSVAVMIGGSWSPFALFVTWVVLLSVDNGAASKMFPWDSLLLEATFLSLFMPATKTLLTNAIPRAFDELQRSYACTVIPWFLKLAAVGPPPSFSQMCGPAAPLYPKAFQILWKAFSHHLPTALQAAASVAWKAAASGDVNVMMKTAGAAFKHLATAERALPSPLLAFCFRYLLVRVLVGFGKIKFQGSETLGRDRFYIREFLANQPITTPLGFIANRLMPGWFWTFSLLVMWVVEIPLPLLSFIPGWCRVVAGVGIIALMGGIQATGNYGYFNGE